MAAVTGAVIAATAAGVSFAQAAKQGKMQRKAEKAASEAMASARKRLDQNFYEGLSIPKEAYELERDAMLQQGQQAMQMAQEADERGVAAAAGRVYQAQQQGQNAIRTDMANAMFGIEEKILTEDSRLRDEQANLDLAEAEGAQLAARDAQQAKAAAISSGISSAAGAVTGFMDAAHLYAPAKDIKAAAQKVGDAGRNFVGNVRRTQAMNHAGANAMSANVNANNALLHGINQNAANNFMGNRALPPIYGFMPYNY